LSTTSKIGASAIVTSNESYGTATWAKVCLPATTGNIKYGYMLYGEYYIRINEVNSYATVTATSLNIRPCAGCTSSNVTINGSNAMFGQNSIISLTGNITSGWYEVYLTNDCSQTTGWVSGTYLSINSNTTNYYNIAGTVNNTSGVSIWGATVTLGSWTTNSSEGFYQYKLPISWAGTITCSHPNYSSSTPPYYSYTANNHNYSKDFILSNNSAPNAPTATAATNITQTSFTANWNSVSGATGYYVDVSTSSSFSNYVYQNEDVGNETSYNFDGLLCNTTYYYRVRAYNNYGISGNSNTISVLTSACCPPPAPPVATAATNVTSSSFQANWNSSSGATSYKLDVATNSNFTNLVLNNVSVGNSTHFNVTGLSNNTTYYYRVRAINNCGSSANSNTISVSLGSAASITVSSAVIPPWQREADAYQGSVTATTSNPTGATWHLEVDVFDAGGNFLSAIIYPSITSATQYFYSSDPQLAVASVEGRQLVFFAVLDANLATSQAGSMQIIEQKWNKKNVVYYNSNSGQLLIPLRYFSNTVSVSVSFSRINGYSTYANNILSSPHLQIDNQEYLVINQTNSLIEDARSGGFKYTLTYNPSGFYQESGIIDLVKIGHINGTSLGSNNIVVLVGGNMDIERSIQSLANQSTDGSTMPWSFVNKLSDIYGKNTWYISCGNISPLQKNAYNIGIALEKIKEICEQAQANNPMISVIAHSKGGLETRMMLDGMGIPNSNPLHFSNNPSTTFNNVTIDGALKCVVFIGTPHHGVNEGYYNNSLAPTNYVNNEINSSEILNYFNGGTNIPSSIRVANIPAYRQCNLSDGSVELNSSEDLNIGSHSFNKFYVKSVPIMNDPGAGSLIDIFCDLGGCLGFLGFAAIPPLSELAFLYLPCDAACQINSLIGFLNVLFSENEWNEGFHHGFLTSSYVLDNKRFTCLSNAQPSDEGILEKINMFINNQTMVDCESPSESDCEPIWIQLLGSVLPNAIAYKVFNDTLYFRIGLSDENGILALPNDGTIGVGDTIVIMTPGEETIKIIVDQTLFTRGKMKIPFISSPQPSMKISHPQFTLKNKLPITTSSSIQAYLNAENAVCYDILQNGDSAFSPIQLTNNEFILPLDTGRNNIIVRINGFVDSVYLRKEIWFLPDSLMNAMTYQIQVLADEYTIGTKVYLENNNVQFYKEIDKPIDTIFLFMQRNNLNLIRFGYQDKYIPVDSAMVIDLAAHLIPISYSSLTDSVIFNFDTLNKVHYWNTVTISDTLSATSISVKQYDDSFSGTGFVAKSRKFEIRHLNSSWSNMRFAAILDQVEGLCKDSIYLMRVINGYSYTKIPFDTSGVIADYDSTVQKLTYNNLSFQNGTASTEALVIMKKQAPVVMNNQNYTVNNGDTLILPLTQFFSDPDIIGQDMTIQLMSSTQQLNAEIIGNVVRIIPDNCWSGIGTFSLEAQHDGLIKTIMDTVIVVGPQVPLIIANGATTFCNGDSVQLTSSIQALSYLWNTNDTTQSITVGFSGNYYVTIVDSAGCSSTSPQLTVNVNSLPIVDAGEPISIFPGNSTIIGGNPTAVGFPPFGYAWHPVTGLDSTNVPNPIATPDASTNYYVVVTDANKCYNADSVLVTVIIPAGMEFLKENRGFILYPNPTTGTLYVSGLGIKDGIYKLSINNTEGQVLLEEKIIVKDNSYSGIINLDFSEKGSFFVIIQRHNYRFVAKIQKAD